MVSLSSSFLFSHRKGTTWVSAFPSKCEIPHHDHHQPLVPPPLGLLQAVESFLRIVREDFAEWVGGKSRGCNLVGGEYFVRICALDVDLTGKVVLGSCNREHGANRGKALVWRGDVEQRDKLSLAAYQTCCGIFRRPEDSPWPPMSALSGISAISHIPTSSSVANSSATAFSHYGSSSPELAPARFRGFSASSRLSRPLSHLRLPSSRRSQHPHRAKAFAGAFPAPREWVRH